MSAVIWGVNGQDGYYLSGLLEKQGIEVVGIGRYTKEGDVDITSYESVANLIRKTKPRYIFNFAANSTTRHGVWKENHETISTGSLNILEAVKEHSPQSKIFLSGSGLQFINNGNPINETSDFDASSMYAVSRIHTTYAARYYRNLGIKVYNGFFFNHDSPRRSDRHINKKIIDVSKRIAAGSKEVLEVGDISVKKEFGFAGDIVRGVWTLIQQDEIVESVIGTGVAHSIEEWLEICFSKVGLQWKNHVVQAENFTAEYRTLVSDPATLFSLGWRPEVSIHELANLMSL